VGVSAEDFFPLLLGHTAQDAYYKPWPSGLAGLQLRQAGIDPVLCTLTDTAGVEEDDVGGGLIPGKLIAPLQ